MMKLTSYDSKDVGTKLERITEEDALELLEGGVSIILRTRSRDFYRVETLNELRQEKRLKEMGIHEKFEMFID